MYIWYYINGWRKCVLEKWLRIKELWNETNHASNYWRQLNAFEIFVFLALSYTSILCPVMSEISATLFLYELLTSGYLLSFLRRRHYFDCYDYYQMLDINPTLKFVVGMYRTNAYSFVYITNSYWWRQQCVFYSMYWHIHSRKCMS